MVGRAWCLAHVVCPAAESVVGWFCGVVGILVGCEVFCGYTWL